MTIILTALGYLYTHVLPFVILLGLLVFVHELGHFLVARYCGVRVEVFSLGFGKKLLSWKRGDTVYCISLIPLGGYVKMFGEQGSESVLTDEDKKVAYSHKTPWQRIAIVLAGPLMNFFFAVFVFSAIAQVGEQTRAAVVAAVKQDSPAAQAGLADGDRVVKVNQLAVRSYEELQNILNKNKGTNVTLEITTATGETKQVAAPVTAIANPNIFSLESQLGQIEGIEPYALNATVAVTADSPAYKAGLRSGDEIVSVNDAKIVRWSDFEALIQKNLIGDQAVDLKLNIARPQLDENGSFTPPLKSTKMDITIPRQSFSGIKTVSEFGFDSTELYLGYVAKDSPAQMAELLPFDKIVSIASKPITKWDDISSTIKSFDGREALDFVIERDGAQILKKITPKVTELTTPFGGIDKRYTIGISPLVAYADPEIVTVAAANPIEALRKGTSRTIDISVMTVMSFVKLFQGQVSVKNVGGMVSIGKAAKDSFEMGAQAFFITMGILSVSLFILNLLPIPVLDGGHLVFYTIELIKGSPLSLRKMEIAQQIGLFILLGLMILAQYNDIVKFLFKS